jgi:uncharacterized protein
VNAPSERDGHERRLSAETLRQLDRCERQLWLKAHRPEEAAPPSDFDLEQRERGRRHEANVRARFVGLIGPIRKRGEPWEDAARETERLLRESRAPLYQPVLLSKDGRRVGMPDFLYWDDGGLVVHDAKLAHNLESHPEITLQLSYYAYLLRESLGLEAVRLEITDGNGELRELVALDDGEVEARLSEAEAVLRSSDEPRVLLAHSKCEECAFYDHCWDEAERDANVLVLHSVQNRFLPILEREGIRTMEQLASREPHSLMVKGIGKLGPAMALDARAFLTGQPSWIAAPALPRGRPLVWFDIEAEPQSGPLGSAVYLWGYAIEAGERTKCEVAIAEPGEAGIERAWEEFLARAGAILDRHPASVWVHYDIYERTWVRKYAAHHGDRDGVAERLLGALWDLHVEGVKPSVRLPLRSYSIKHVAKHVGFRWRNPEAGSQWSIVQYRRAIATTDDAERRRLLDAIAEYNEDDLLAMRAVWEWLEANAPAHA